MTSAIVEQIVGAVARDLAVTPYGDAEVVRLPFAFSDGHGLSVLVSDVGGDVLALSDRGQVAEVLWSHGLDLTGDSPRRSWTALRDHLGIPPAIMGASDDQYQLTMASTRQTVGEDVLRLGEAMLLAEGLRVLARPKSSRTLRDRIVSSARDHNLAIIPRAGLRTRFGAEREVTAKVVGSRSVFVQGVGGGNRLTAYDHARSVFSDAQGGSERLSVIAQDTHLEQWQRTALSEVSQVVSERALPQFFASLAA